MYSCCQKVKEVNLGTSLVVQWFNLHVSNAGFVDLISVQGTKILHAVWHGQKSFLKGKVHFIADFPGGPVVKIPCFHCRQCGFDLVGEVRFWKPQSQKKKKKKKDINLLSKAVNNIFSAPALETNFHLHYLNTNIFKHKIINVSPMKFFLYLHKLKSNQDTTFFSRKY